MMRSHITCGLLAMMLPIIARATRIIRRRVKASMMPRACSVTAADAAPKIMTRENMMMSDHTKT